MGFWFTQRGRLMLILVAMGVAGPVGAELPVPALTVPEASDTRLAADDTAATGQEVGPPRDDAEDGPIPAVSADQLDAEPNPAVPGDIETVPGKIKASESELLESGPQARNAADAPETVSPCREPVESAAASWLDKSNIVFYQAVCSSVAWFDGFFGSRGYDRASAQTFGRVGFSGFWDQRNGFDEHLRFRARYALPQLQKRTSLLIGRGTTREAVEGDERASPVDSIPSSFNKVEDDSLLIGLGYSRGNGIERGFDFSVGARLRAPPEPYVKTSYRRAWDVSARTLISAVPLGYWRYNEGLGATLGVSVDQLVTRRMMLRWSNSGKVSQDREVEGIEWVSRLSLFQQLTNRRALTYGLLVQGESQADVALRNYGFEFRYRQRILRQWLFLELLSSMTWPKDFLWEQREPNFGTGIGIEMYFGPTPEEQLR